MSEVAASAPSTGASTPPTETTREATAPAPKDGASENPYRGTKHRVKIDGVEQEVEYDELVSDYQRKKASEKRFNEAAQLQKATTELLQGLATGDQNAWGWLQKNVPKDTFKKIAEEFLISDLEYQELTPEQKRLRELEERERQRQEEDERRKKDDETQQWQRDVEAAGQEINGKIEEFFQTTGIKPNTAVLLRLSEHMLAHLNKGKPIPPVEALYNHVARCLDLDALDVIKSKPADKLLEWMPKETVDQLRQLFIEKATATQPRRGIVDDQAPVGRREKAPKKVGIDDAFSLLEQKIKKGR